MKYIHSLFYYSCIALILSTFSGCGYRYYEWGESFFYQGEQIYNYACDIDTFIQSVSIHDELTTLATFDALPLFDEVRTVYSRFYAYRHGYSKDRYQAFLRRQLEENNLSISFVILAFIPHIPDNLLTEKDADWSLLLKVGTNLYRPTEISSIELSPEFEEFFSEEYNSSKTPYLVKFNAKDVDGRSILSSNVHSISLLFRGVERESYLTWHVPHRRS